MDYTDRKNKNCQANTTKLLFARMNVPVQILVQKGRKTERPVPKRPHHKGHKPKRPYI